MEIESRILAMEGHCSVLCSQQRLMFVAESSVEVVKGTNSLSCSLNSVKGERTEESSPTAANAFFSLISCMLGLKIWVWL